MFDSDLINAAISKYFNRTEYGKDYALPFFKCKNQFVPIPVIKF